MGKAGRNERRKVAAQYLNGLASAVVAAGVLGPAAAGQGNLAIAAVAASISVALHALARWTVAQVED